MEALSRIPVVADIFQCTCCGFCCHGETTVSLNEADQKRMATLMGLPREEVLRRFWCVNGREVQIRCGMVTAFFMTEKRGVPCTQAVPGAAGNGRCIRAS